MAPGPIPLDVDAAKRQFGTPLTCRCCGKVRHLARDCPQAYNIHYMIANEHEELIEHLLMTEDVLKAAKVGEHVETEQGRLEDFASSSK